MSDEVDKEVDKEVVRQDLQKWNKLLFQIYNRIETIQTLQTEIHKLADDLNKEFQKTYENLD